MSIQELKMRCDLCKTGANTHKLSNLQATVISCMQLYLLNNGDDLYFCNGVDALHTLNGILHTNFKFIDLIISYLEEFDGTWGCVEKVCLGSKCERASCIKIQPKSTK